MTELEWRIESLPVGTRMIDLEDKAEDTGLTAAEKLELATLQRRWSELFSRFVRAKLSEGRA